jgi:putative DNA primase/helicase
MTLTLLDHPAPVSDADFLNEFLELAEPEEPIGRAAAPSPRDRAAALPAAPVPAVEPEPETPGYRLQTLADITPVTTNWLCPGILPRGRLTFLTGDSGAGKSYLAADLAARVSRLTCRPGTDGQPAGGAGDGAGDGDSPVRVLWATAEDPADLLYNRLATLGADLTRIAALTPPADSPAAAAARGLSAGACPLPLSPADLRHALADSPRADLLVIDGLRADPLDKKGQGELAVLLAELAALAAEADVAVVVLWRSVPGRRAQRALAAWTDAAAVAVLWQVARDPADPDLRRLSAVKWNLAADAHPLGFRLKNGRLLWQLLPLDPRFAPGGERLTAAAWLREQLADGPRPVRELQAEARDCGFAQRTLRRAREDLGLRAVRLSGGGPASWHWQLPPAPMLPSPFPVDWEPDEHIDAAVAAMSREDQALADWLRGRTETPEWLADRLSAAVREADQPAPVGQLGQCRPISPTSE